MKKDDCIFCKIAAGEIPSATVYEDDDFRAILDLGPAAKGHTLVIPKSHSDNLLSVEPDTAAKALKVISKTANAIKEALGCDGINVVQNNGEVAGQTVFHFHMHLIPRYLNDGNQDKLTWNHAEFTSEEIEEIATELRG